MKKKSATTHKTAKQQKSPAQAHTQKKASATATATTTERETDELPVKIAIDRIDPGPYNYRRHFDLQKLNELADTMCRHGQLENIVVRPHPTEKGRYQLAIGERRLRAAPLAGLDTLTAYVRELNDQQICEIQLIENLQREDPHPMHEALGIAQLLQHGTKPKEIAAILGKSTSYVFQRLRLATLIEPIQEMYLAGILLTHEALAIAALAAPSQESFYAKNCEGWQDKTNFRLCSFKYLLEVYKYDLTTAAFDTKSKTLVEGAPACTRCPYNTATLKTLFPEEAKEKTCLNHTCYENKWKAHMTIGLVAAYLENEPAAILVQHNQTELADILHEAVPQSADLPVHSLYSVTVPEEPIQPDPEEYGIGTEDDDANTAGYEEAMEEYAQELAEYKTLMAGDDLKKGLLLAEKGCEVVYFTERQIEEKPKAVKVTNKQVVESIKAGTLTAELIAGETQRLAEREAKEKQGDAAEIQRLAHTSFRETVETGTNEYIPTDRAVAAMLLYESLPYHLRRELEEKFFPGLDDDDDDDVNTEKWFAFFENMPDNQFAYLVRTVLACADQSKRPGRVQAFALFKLAGLIGIDTARILADRAEITREREVKMAQRVAALHTKLAKQQPRLPATQPDDTGEIAAEAAA